MKYCTFGNTAEIILENLRDDESLTQIDFITKLFESFYNSDADYSFDCASVSRWIKGTAPVTSLLKSYYMNDENRENIGIDIENNLLSIIVDIDITVRNIYDLLANDSSVSERKKRELSDGFPFENDTEKCDFIGRVILFALKRKQISPDNLLVSKTDSVHDRVIGAEVPPPCKYFCGRDKELEEFYGIMKTNTKVFVTGIPGIGKSEFVKAYAKKYRREYSDILYFNYNGDLKNMITAAMFADDIYDDREKTFRNHHKYFHNLGNSVMMIIDNFNVSESADKFLNLMLLYNCRIIFTTRSVIESDVSFELKEIENADILYSLAGKFYDDIDKNKAAVTEIIKAVHHHTFAVELAARVMQKGLHTPDEILEKLKENSADPHTTDKVNVRKDGINTRATYFEHLKVLCSFDTLNDELKDVMRNMVFIPESGIRSRRFAKLLFLADLNSVNEMIELGYICNPESDIIFLHPIIRDIAVRELEPSYNECSVFIENIHALCLNIGQYLYDHELITSTSVNIMRYSVKDNIPAYLTFVEDVLGFMDNYRDETGMYFAVSEMNNIINCGESVSARDKSLFYNYRARCKSVFENDEAKAVYYQQKALKIAENITDPVLLANLNMNMGVIYHDSGNRTMAKQFMEKAISIYETNEIVTADYIAMKKNYAAVLSNYDEPLKAHTVLLETARIAVKANSSELAGLLFDAACADVRMRFFDEAIHLFNEAFQEYEKFLDDDSLNMRKQIAAYLLEKYGYILSDTYFPETDQRL